MVMAGYSSPEAGLAASRRLGALEEGGVLLPPLGRRLALVRLLALLQVILQALRRHLDSIVCTMCLTYISNHSLLFTTDLKGALCTMFYPASTLPLMIADFQPPAISYITDKISNLGHIHR